MADEINRPSMPRDWQNWANLVLAIWLFLSPWILGFEPLRHAALDAWVVGVIVGVLSVAALAQAEAWEEWINLLLGAWLFVSPWVLGFSSNTNAMWNALIVGALVFIVAGWELTEMQQFSRSR